MLVISEGRRIIRNGRTYKEGDPAPADFSPAETALYLSTGDLVRAEEPEPEPEPEPVAAPEPPSIADEGEAAVGVNPVSIAVSKLRAFLMGVDSADEVRDLAALDDRPSAERHYRTRINQLEG